MTGDDFAHRGKFQRLCVLYYRGNGHGSLPVCLRRWKETDHGCPGVTHYPRHADDPADDQQRHAKGDPVGEGIPAALAAITVAKGLMVEPSVRDPRAEQHGGGRDNRIKTGGQHYRHQQGVERQ